MTSWLAAGGPWTYLGLFALSASESSAFVGLVVPGETFLLLAGALASQDRLNLSWVLAATISGAVVGDLVGYAIGRRFGACDPAGRLARRGMCERMARARRVFLRHGGAAVFFGRFVGFLRPVVPFAAGSAGMPLRAFVVFNVAGAVLWGVGTLLAGYFLGTAIAGPLRRGGAAALAALATAWLVVKLARAAQARRADRPSAAPAQESLSRPAREEVKQ